MGFDEPDVRDAYRQGARDLYESIVGGMRPRQAREREAWLRELDKWEHGEPPPPPPVG
jgi:hypothetical protein